jgi:hypothetical protein
MMNFDPSLLLHFLDSAATVPMSNNPREKHKPIRIEDITSDKRESLKKNQKIASMYDKRENTTCMKARFSAMA